MSGDESTTLSWDAVGAATGYRVYQSTTSGSGYVQIANLASLNMLVTGLVNGTTYYYVVTAYDAMEESLPSIEVAATPFTSSGVPVTMGLVLSLDAGTVAQQYANGAPVSVWTDTSGTGADAVGASGTAPVLVTNAIAGRPALRFDGADDFMALPAGFEDFTGGLSMYVIARPSVLTSGYKMVALGNGAGSDDIYLGRNGTSDAYQYVTNSSSGSYGWFATNGGLVVGEAAMLSVIQPGGSANNIVTAEVAKNGTVIGSGGVYVPPNTTRNVNYIGKSFWAEGSFAGDIAEVLIYERALTAQEQAQLNSYFELKYDVGVTRRRCHCRHHPI